ncbi:hypothetical protein ADINL_2327 [Nitrincola lacisaponensis]|uniref:Uncharacterized protein n=1 Tax=Nitrincola lacisaponensis TaxID=267850 RepID=A0A063XYG3_9GAMM|nr:hypothetical protein [Nitrincola lacisaponensis]KDE39198.1 hypothetical protein ADINL_2327 [Nitrincola lacisaponensis]
MKYGLVCIAIFVVFCGQTWAAASADEGYAQSAQLEQHVFTCREFNDGLVYNAEFADVFSLDTAQAIALDPGLMAVRVYWTEMANHLDEPMMQVQLYLEPEVNLQFPKDEGTHNVVETLVRSGFRYFPHRPYAYPDNNDEFNFRYVIQDGEELVSTYLLRYRTNLTSSGIQAIQLGTTFRRNPVVYLYIGEESPPDNRQDLGGLQHGLAVGKIHDPSRYLRLRIPSELQPIMQSPYRPCQGTTVQR